MFFLSKSIVLIAFYVNMKIKCENILIGYICILRSSLHTNYQPLFWPEISYVPDLFQNLLLKKYYCSCTKREIWLPSNLSRFASASIPIPLVSSCSTKRYLSSKGHHSLPCNFFALQNPEAFTFAFAQAAELFFLFT